MGKFPASWEVVRAGKLIVKIFMFAVLILASSPTFSWPVSQCKSGNPLWMGLNTYKGPSGETARIHDVIRNGAIAFNNELTVAVWFGYDDIVRKLLKNKDLVKKYGAQSLYLAASMGRLHEMSMLLNAGVPPNATVDNGFTPLFGAAEYGCVRAMRLVVNSGANVNHKADVAWTLLEDAVISKQFDAARFLLDNGYTASNQERELIKRILHRMGMESRFAYIFGSK